MFKAIKPYPAELKSLLTFTGFLKQYYKNLSKTETDKQAYETTEELHVEYFGARKYSCFKTFRVVRARNVKK